ncbi:MAG: type secretion-associated serine protease mycosin [Mycobacterium sp.]|nr:type secretion-associated serine protease mycosin [Mycobacterium sp.]
MTGAGRLVAAVLLVAVSSPMPTARAVTAPVVDDSLLPAAADPTGAGVQREPCTAPAEATGKIASGKIAPGKIATDQPTAVDTPETHPGPASADLPAVWALSRGEGQQVAVIDTGVTRHHRLADLRAGGDYVSVGDGTQDCDGHGTLVAGIIAATPDADDVTGFTGIAPAAAILTIRQSSAKFGPVDSTTTGVGDVTTMARAVRLAADLGATVINISTVACTTGALDDGALGAALAYAVDVKDVVVVAAAGNVGGAGRCPRPPQDSENAWASATVVTSPGWYDDYVLTVGSVGPTAVPSDFSLPGPWVDIAAPGEQVVSLHPGGSGVVDTVTAFGRAVPISGTSYAAPVVSGVAALVRSRFPELTARQVMQRIEATAHALGDGWSPATGHGLVDPAAALSDEALTRPAPPAPAAPLHIDPTDAPVGTSADRTAFTGAAICAGLLAVAVAAARLRRDGGQRR